MTKRERKALAPPRPAQVPSANGHIHCISCGRHLDPDEFREPSTAQMLRCQHRATFPSCTSCAAASQALLDEHDRTGQAVRSASAWH